MFLYGRFRERPEGEVSQVQRIDKAGLTEEAELDCVLND